MTMFIWKTCKKMTSFFLLMRQKYYLNHYWKFQLAPLQRERIKKVLKLKKIKLIKIIMKNYKFKRNKTQHKINLKKLIIKINKKI